MKKKIGLIFALLLAASLLLVACGSAPETPAATGHNGVLDVNAFDGKLVACCVGTVFDEYVMQYLPGAEVGNFNNTYDCITALKAGKVDAFMEDDAAIRKLLAYYPELEMLEPFLTTDSYGVTVALENTELLNSLNEFIAQIRADGTRDDMLARWLDTADSPPMPKFELPKDNGKLVFVTVGTIDGFNYYEQGELAGFDVEFAYRFAQYAGKDLEIVLSDFAGRIPMVQSGKADFGASLTTITEERKKSVAFSDPYYEGGAAVCVLRGDAPAVEPEGFWASLSDSFYNNLIVQARWKLILDGLGVTMIITVCAFVLGTLLAFFICYLNMHKNPVLHTLGKGYVALLRGVPMVVLLMIIYYLVFAKVNINPILAAIIAYGLNGGAYIGEILRSNILTVDKGQIEAARSMGFSKSRAFLNVTLPQACRRALPVYKSEFISMLKSTAVVGYISVNDLTKIGDIIRSRTYDAFFPLLIVAAIYLITASLMVWLFDRINLMTDKRARRNRS